MYTNIMLTIIAFLMICNFAQTVEANEHTGKLYEKLDEILSFLKRGGRR